MYGNPRYVVQTGLDRRVYSADLWEPVLKTKYFPVNMPYTSSDFKEDQGVDSHGIVYNNVSVKITTDGFSALIASKGSYLNTSDIRSVWFVLPRSNDPSYDTYYRIHDKVKVVVGDDTDNYAIRKVVNIINSTDDVVGMYVVVASYLTHVASSSADLRDDMDTLGTAVIDARDDNSVTIRDFIEASLEYRRMFPYSQLTTRTTSWLEYVFLDYPKAATDNEKLASANEMNDMYRLLPDRGASEEAISAASDMYSIGTRTFTLEYSSVQDVVDILNIVNSINAPIDGLPVLQSKFRKLVVEVFRFIGLRVEYQGNNLLRRLPTFSKLFLKRVNSIYEPLRTLLVNYGYGRYVRALNSQMGESGQPYSTPRRINPLREIRADSLAPVGYNMRRLVTCLVKDDSVVYNLQMVMFDEIVSESRRVLIGIDAGTFADPIELFRLRELLNQILSLDNTKRRIVVEKLMAIQRMVNSPLLNNAIQQVDKHREAIFDNFKTADRLLRDIDFRQKGLREQLLHAPMDASESAVKPPRIVRPPSPKQYYSLHTSDRPSRTFKTNPNVKVNQRCPSPDDNGEGCPTPVLMSVAPKTDTAYYPMTEATRRRVIRDVFQEDPDSYRRVNYAVGFEPLKRYDEKSRFVSQSISSDGNCFYRTLSQIIFGTQRKHDILRRFIYNAAVKHKDSLARLYNIENEESLEEILTPASFANEFCILVASVALGVRVYTYSRNKYMAGWCNPPALQYDPKRWSDDAIYIDNVNSNHFEPVHRGISRGHDIKITDRSNNCLFSNLPYPTLSPNTSLRIDAGLAGRILIAALLKNTLSIEQPYKDLTGGRRALKVEFDKRKDKKDGFLRAMSDLITSPGYLEKEEVSRFIDISLVKKETKLDWGAIKNLHIDSSTITFLQVDQKTKSTNRIEDFNAQDDQRVLMVDFANKNLGGGVLSDGLVQEELLIVQDTLSQDTEATIMAPAKKFKCYVCGKDITRLSRHLMTVHNVDRYDVIEAKRKVSNSDE
ncbi:hypothetical protein RRG08_043892 [Elysia crispata]|uniref:OTU domain-containing protein n=1 Tax=Elysia crispata TaxID=231223 RepID=A0AAE1E6D8_9GAST|nr:hypothetical protein RRG08_043892 [Elysia crispata]